MIETIDEALARRWSRGPYTPEQVRDAYRAAAQQFPAMFEDMARMGKMGRTSFDVDARVHAYKAGAHDFVVSVHQMAALDLTEVAAKETGRHDTFTTWWKFWR